MGLPCFTVKSNQVFCMATEMSGSLYSDLYAAFKLRHVELSGSACQEKANLVWREIKQQSKTSEELESNVKMKIKKLKGEAACRKASFTNYFAQVSIIVSPMLK